METIQLNVGYPQPRDYNNLRKSVEWDELDENIITKSFENSLFGVWVQMGNATVGMGRVVGDGAMFYYIQDVIVDPMCQGQGIGKSIMDKLIEYLKSSARDGAVLGLMSSQSKENFYARFGFISRPNHFLGHGMTMLTKDLDR